MTTIYVYDDLNKHERCRLIDVTTYPDRAHRRHAYIDNRCAECRAATPTPFGERRVEVAW